MSSKEAGYSRRWKDSYTNVLRYKSFRHVSESLHEMQTFISFLVMRKS